LHREQKEVEKHIILLEAELESLEALLANTQNSSSNHPLEDDVHFLGSGQDEAGKLRSMMEDLRWDIVDAELLDPRSLQPSAGGDVDLQTTEGPNLEELPVMIGSLPRDQNTDSHNANEKKFLLL